MINLPKLSFEMVQPVANLFLKAKTLQLPLFFHFRLGKSFHSLMWWQNQETSGIPEQEVLTHESKKPEAEAEPKSDEITMLIKKGINASIKWSD